MRLRIWQHRAVAVFGAMLAVSKVTLLFRHWKQKAGSIDQDATR